MSSLLIQEPPLQVLPSLAKEVGLNAALVLQQTHYWCLTLNKEWVYVTIEQWQEQFPFWSDRTIRRAIKDAKDSGFLLIEQKGGQDRVNHYRISDSMRPDCPLEAATLTSSLEEAETTQRENGSKEEEKEAVEGVWGYYVKLFKPRRKEIDKTQRKVIVDALKVASPKECCVAIRELHKSDYHQKRGEHRDRDGKKYRDITYALKGRPRLGESTRSRIDAWLDEAETGGKAAPADVNAQADAIRKAQGLE